MNDAELEIPHLTSVAIRIPKSGHFIYFYKYVPWPDLIILISKVRWIVLLNSQANLKCTVYLFLLSSTLAAIMLVLLLEAHFEC